MSKKAEGIAKIDSGCIEGKQPRCLPIAEKGIHTANDFARFMSAVMSDVIMNTITPQAANATVNAGGKLLKVVEMTQRWGTQNNSPDKDLVLVAGERLLQ